MRQNINEGDCEVDWDSLELDFQGLMLNQRLFWYLSLRCTQEERGLIREQSPREEIGCAWEDAHCPG